MGPAGGKTVGRKTVGGLDQCDTLSRMRPCADLPIQQLAGVMARGADQGWVESRLDLRWHRYGFHRWCLERCLGMGVASVPRSAARPLKSTDSSVDKGFDDLRLRAGTGFGRTGCEAAE